MERSAAIEQDTIARCLTAVVESATGSIIGHFSFAPDFPAFAGHFPGQPVLPAVVQLAAVRLLAARHLGLDLVPTCVRRAKFKTMIGPAQPLTITIDIERTGSDVVIGFAIATDTAKAATGEIACRKLNDKGGKN